MTTREQIIAAANIFNAYKQAFDWYAFDEEELEHFYAIAFEAGRVAEREETNRRPLPDNTAPYIRARGDTK
jgi:hypothetical protein